MSTVKINGKTYSGRSVVVMNGTVIVDGKVVTGEGDRGTTIHVVVEGNIQDLKVDACASINVNGAVGSLNSISGDVRCGDIYGSVHSTSGDVHCGHVQGSVSTISGDIHHEVRREPLPTARVIER